MSTILKILAALVVAGLFQHYAPVLLQVVAVICAMTWFFLDAARRARRDAGRQ
jgi:hypothetical protein